MSHIKFQLVQPEYVLVVYITVVNTYIYIYIYIEIHFYNMFKNKYFNCCKPQLRFSSEAECKVMNVCIYEYLSIYLYILIEVLYYICCLILIFNRFLIKPLSQNT